MMNNRFENIHCKTNLESQDPTALLEVAMTMPPPDSSAYTVASARNTLRLKQADFGELIGRGQSLVSKYERGKVEPPGSVVMQCIQILGGGQAPGEVVSSAEVAQLVESRLEGPQFSKLRSALVNLIESVSAVPRSR